MEWGLRKYPDEANVVWDGDSNCEHEWIVEETKRPNLSGGKTNPFAQEKLAIKGTENYKEQVDYHKRITTSSFCKKCNAWYGQLGLQSTLELYLEHLLQITKELKRVLKPTGIMFWNMADSYYGGHPGGSIHGEITGNRYGDRGMIPQWSEGRPQGRFQRKEKCMVLAPERLVIRMVDE